MKNLLVITFLFANAAYTQIASQKRTYAEQLELNIKSSKSWVVNKQNSLQRAERDWKDAEAEINEIIQNTALFDQHRVEREKKVQNLLGLIEEERRKLPWLKRTLGKENKVYKCMTQKIEKGHPISACEKDTELPPSLSSKLELYSKYWIYDERGAKEAKILMGDRLKSQINKKERSEKGIKKHKTDIVFWENDLEAAKKEQGDYIKFKVASENELRCSPNTPTIDLEKDGAFKDLPFDHQDDIGTCFANVGKNLLYAATDGKSNASFLDMALQYTKVMEKNEGVYDIDGGSACSALNVIKQTGFCDKSDSPLENGETSFQLGLSGKADSVQAQAGTLEKLKAFLKAKGGLKNRSPEEVSVMAGKAIRLLKKDPLIELPRPRLSRKIFSKGPFFLYYASHYPEEKKQKNPHSALYKELEKMEQTIDDAIIKEISENAKFDLKKVVERETHALFEKYELPHEVREKVLPDWKIKEAMKIDRDHFLQKIEHTLAFYDQLEGSEGSFSIERLTSEDCAERDRELRSFGKALKDLVSHAERMQVPLEQMLDGDKLLPNEDLLQLAVAPKCLNPSNRKTLANDIMCSTKSIKDAAKNYGASQEQYVFFRALESLKKGMPLGNSFDAGQTKHINTIVGVRYNSKKDGCEFKIRESMTASSYWKDADAISKNMSSLTEVDKK